MESQLLDDPVTIRRGKATPLGTTWDGKGVNVAVWSAHASAVDFCLFQSAADPIESKRFRLPAHTDHVWHGYIPGVMPGQVYGLRVHGSFDPKLGHWFNPQKLIADPYAKAVCGHLVWHDSLCDGPGLSEQLAPDPRDTARLVPKCIIVDHRFDWKGDIRPRVAWNETIIYECHVKGLTFRHPDVPDEHRGRYVGLASEPMLDHLKKLGVTSVELLPVQHSVNERPLTERGLVNYWGYNPLAFFAPHGRYASADDGAQVVEFKQMVAGLHRAGIEVILDVVFNHTCEGDEAGPTLCFRGMDNSSYYRLSSRDRRLYENVTGCGNALNCAHPAVQGMILDCLHYWFEEMHVDGFRFDLATTLARGEDGTPVFDGLLRRIAEDPALSTAKLIAEPWDIGGDGHQLGRFSGRWSEWNDQYRRTIRRFWRGDAGTTGQLAWRMAGSEDIFGPSGRGACTSINYITAHDGFTMADLVSYDRKHNQANGWENSDGSDDNGSCNWGCEGPTKERKILQMREQMQRNFLATLLLSKGVPMLLAGDELGRTQRGNNNAYCQDNEINWMDWQLNRRQQQLRRFTQKVIALRRRLEALRSDAFFQGRVLCDCGLRDVTWLRPDGAEMTLTDWENANHMTVGMLLHHHKDGAGDNIEVANTILIVYHRGSEQVRFALPQVEFPAAWAYRIDTARPGGIYRDKVLDAIAIKPRSLILCEVENE